MQEGIAPDRIALWKRRAWIETHETGVVIMGFYASPSGNGGRGLKLVERGLERRIELHRPLETEGVD